MYHKTIPAINAGSMADIAFLLLIFFLVTTTLDQEIGIPSILPPPVTDPISTTVADRNVLEVAINGADRLQIENRDAALKDLTGEVKRFYTNPAQSPDYPQGKKITKALCEAKIADPKSNSGSWHARKNAVALIGAYHEIPAQAVISIQLDRSTSYATYIAVQNELSAGLNQLRDSCAGVHFGMPYSKLNPVDPEDRERIKAIRLAFPRRISEAEPVDY